MRILFDSRQDKYKTPFGTLRTGESCVLHIEIPAACGAVAVTLMTETCEEEPYRSFPFAKESSDGVYDTWSCRFSLPERGLYFYWFRIDKTAGSFRLFRQGSQTNMEAGEKWQISSIPADFSVPSYAQGAVIYQIFPDRFHQAGRCDLTEKLKPFWVHENLTDTPQYTADAGGNWCTDFYGGNLAGIREKLPYLHSLGVGIIYLNPIFMACSNHRYDTADYKRIDPMLGTEEDFSSLCAQAHALGIRIILDGVFSHTGSNSVYFDAKGVFGNGAVSNPDSPYRAWYRFRHYPDDYDAWWNMPTLPNVEELTESYVNFIIEDEDSVIAHWLKLGADGFRLDVVDELPDEFVSRIKKRMRALNPEALLIGEVWEDASNKRAYGISRRYFVDAELDSVMNYPWQKAIIAYVTGADDGSGLAESVIRLAENYPPQVLSCVMNLLGSHDTARILTRLGDGFSGSKAEWAEHRLSPEQRERAAARLRLAAFLQFTLPGMASIYYGDEAGMEGGDDPFCRGYYPWGAEDLKLRSYYAVLCRLKNGTQVLKTGGVRVLCAGGGRFAFSRTAPDGERANIYVNLSGGEWELEEPGEVTFAERLGSLRAGRCTLLPGGFCLLLDGRCPETAEGQHKG